jgi:WD40 repeat protein
MDRTAKLWHLEYTFPLRVYAGHEKDVDVVRFHPNCNYLATAGADKTIRLWSHADAKMVIKSQLSMRLKESVTSNDSLHYQDKSAASFCNQDFIMLSVVAPLNLT